MTHDELLAKLDVTRFELISYEEFLKRNNALRAVVELHSKSGYHHANVCDVCDAIHPCPTIQDIEKELK